jgi:succinate-semialdehyde dehydrogenase / glutarate-semialdehyde dehydrogenase
MAGVIADALQHGANMRTGGKRIGNKCKFFEPAVLADMPREARV